MWSMFAPLGWVLDQTRLVLPPSPRWTDVRRQAATAVGAMGAAALLVALTSLGVGFTWYAGTHPTPARFFMVAQPHDALEDGSGANDQIHAVAPAPVSGSSEAPERPHVYELSAGFSPQMSDLRVQEWVSHSLMQIYNFNMNNAPQVLSDARWMFRPDTYDLFMAQMNASRGGIVPAVIKNSLEVSFIPTSTVRITGLAVQHGYRVWKMEVHGLLYFSGATAEGNVARPQLFHLVVEEVPTSENPYGLVIAQIDQTADVANR